MEKVVSFQYAPGMEVYFIKNGKPGKGFIKEVQINIINWRYGYCTPVIKYLVGKDWYNQSELYDDRELFKRRVKNLKEIGTLI